jgi:hypothetical protein
MTYQLLTQGFRRGCAGWKLCQALKRRILGIGGFLFDDGRLAAFLKISLTVSGSTISKL